MAVEEVEGAPQLAALARFPGLGITQTFNPFVRQRPAAPASGLSSLASQADQNTVLHLGEPRHTLLQREASQGSLRQLLSKSNPQSGKMGGKKVFHKHNYAVYYLYLIIKYITFNKYLHLTVYEAMSPSFTSYCLFLNLKAIPASKYIHTSIP